LNLLVSDLKRRLKEGAPDKVYLFYGEEKFLIDTYLKQIKGAVVSGPFADFNYNIFTDNNADFDEFVESVEGYPQMADKKMIVVKDCDFLKQADYQESMEKIIKNAPDYAVLVFVEEELTKVKKDLIKCIEKVGCVVDFKKQTPSDLRAWVNRTFALSGKKMRVDDMEHLVTICEHSLSKLKIECDKLIAAVGDEEVVTRGHIDQMVQVPFEYKVFQIADKILSCDASVYSILNELKNNKEQPTVIISLIYSQLASLLMFKNLERERVNAEDFLPPNRKFLARRLSSECRKHSPDKLRMGMKLCAQYDVDIKTGKIEGFTALEIIMAQLMIKKEKQ